MWTVNIGVRHNDNAAIAQIIKLEIIARFDPKRQRQIGQFLIAGQLFGWGAGDIQYFTTERKNRLCFAIARLFCLAAGRVSLNQK